MQTQYEIYQGVITADIVNSQGLSEIDYQDLMKVLAEHLTQLSEEIGAVFHIFRGDSFQIVFKQQNTLFLHAIKLRLFFLKQGLDVKLSLACGDIKVTANDLATATGEALISAGRGLDAIKNERLLYNGIVNECFLLNIKFIDLLLSKLSIKQAHALLLYLQQNRPEHAQLAIQLQTSRANVTKLLNLAHYTLIDAFIVLSETQLFSKET